MNKLRPSIDLRDVVVANLLGKEKIDKLNDIVRRRNVYRRLYSAKLREKRANEGR